METSLVQVSIRGVLLDAPAVRIQGRAIITRGKWLKTAEIHDEHWQPGSLENPDLVIMELKRQGLNADIFTFAQKLPETQPRFKFPLEWDNLAVIPITSFADWWENRLPQETRKNVRRSAKRGLATRTAVFDEALVQGIKRIYDETPFRQGRRFWHYGKDIELVRRENSSYLDVCDFIGAYCQDELIGILKLVYAGNSASIMQIVSLNKHHDKRPTNALLAKAVEICEQRGMAYLIYGQYVYGKNDQSPLTEFKRRNGFEQVLVPRYFIPLTMKGNIAMNLGLHRGLRTWLPRWLERWLLDLRAKSYERMTVSQTGPATELPSAP
jgi:hypothetical protein